MQADQTQASRLADSMIAELKREADVTRVLLARVPEDRLKWSPHEKSMSLGQLAMHIASLPRGVAELLNETPAEAPNVQIPTPATVAEIVDEFDASVTRACDLLAGWGDPGLDASWTMMIGGEPVLVMPRKGMARSLILNHLYHHRGQLTVYLRLLDVPLPPIYGPTADESPFG